ncbi:MAG TPA: hypothetical protein PLU52_08820 [Opitutaceae bacterium]|nr:hypothetical protein [Opitutaceae bacterium]HND62284.1 hypothetical protein [Opitutaceae bacterium]
MLHKHVLKSEVAKTSLVERRRDPLTRAVINGLEQLNEHLERLPHPEDRAEALAALTCFAQRVKIAIDSSREGTPATGE